MQVLITAGPTREFLDDVRFLSNPSTGAMGFACAAAAAKAGHKVTLVTGPTHLPDPRGVKTVRVVSAREMRDAAMKAYSKCGAVIAAAAVSDYRPARCLVGKMKKDRDLVTMALVRTPDILAEMARHKGGRILIGFALESHDALANGLDKLNRKHLDHVVVNSPDAFAVDRMDAIVLHADGTHDAYPRVRKDDLARRLIALLR